MSELSVDLTQSLLSDLNLKHISPDALLSDIQDQLNEFEVYKQNKKQKQFLFVLQVKRNRVDEDDENGEVEENEDTLKHFTGLSHLLWWTLSALVKNNVNFFFI